jgi:tRNA U54 and U55 pseudouridine synthase Pus10
MLGNGRPFIIEMANPRKNIHTLDTYKSMEDKINQEWTPLININGMQEVSKYRCTKYNANQTQSSLYKA